LQPGKQLQAGGDNADRFTLSLNFFVDKLLQQALAKPASVITG